MSGRSFYDIEERVNYNKEVGNEEIVYSKCYWIVLMLFGE